MTLPIGPGADDRPSERWLRWLRSAGKRSLGSLEPGDEALLAEVLSLLDPELHPAEHAAELVVGLLRRHGYGAERTMSFLAATSSAVGRLAGDGLDPDDHLGLLRAIATSVPAGMALVADDAITKLEVEAFVDALTALGNRRALDRRLRHLLPGAGIVGSELAVAMIDIDGLKAVNDRDGHAAGDLVLRDFARCLADNCREGDEAFRVGGDEFVLVLSCASTAQAERCLARIGATTGTAFSYGIAHSSADLHDLIEAADVRLYARRRHRSTHRIQPPVRRGGRRQPPPP